MRVTPNRDSTHLYGSLNLLNGQETVMSRDPCPGSRHGRRDRGRSKKMNSETTAAYLEKVLLAHPDKPILMMWDNGPHHKGGAVQAILDANPRLEVIWFPAGSPDLNPQEHVWKAMRQAVCHTEGPLWGHTLNTLTHVADAADAADAAVKHLETHTFPCSLLSEHAYTNIRAIFK